MKEKCEGRTKIENKTDKTGKSRQYTKSAQNYQKQKLR